MGARVLSVVDCFDALTSDRPYRPRCLTRKQSRYYVTEQGRCMTHRS